MSQHVPLRRLRPYLFTSFSKQFPRAHRRGRPISGSPRKIEETSGAREVTNDYERRVKQLEEQSPPAQWYPRLQPSITERIHSRELQQRYEHLQNGQTDLDDIKTTSGRVRSVRKAGSKLLFIDVEQGDEKVQAVVQLNRLLEPQFRLESDTSEAVRLSFNSLSSTVRRGDWYEFQGHPHRSSSGELSMLASHAPKLLSPALHQIPDVFNDAEARVKNRHVDMLVNRPAIQTIRVRHLVEKYIKDFFDNDGFTAVHTPLLTAGAGGAIARPFDTEATELEGQRLNLRIAPELWLKRLVVGGITKVYEIGPAFRNEGVDATHNPEFYICEFYEAFATLEDLMTKTEKLLSTLSAQLTQMQTEKALDSLPPIPTFTTPFKRLPFLPTLQLHFPDQPLPNLTRPAAQQELLTIFTDNSLPVPSNPTMPRLLDALASHYIEPHCNEPTFITHHPACLSPLAKHFTCPDTGQIVSARAELFISGREMANMYEEENSPFEQRRKFHEQLKYRTAGGSEPDGGTGEDGMEVDESYLQALEWGLPPTGGWGCGVDRLVMLFTGRERIGDVLPFGTLRNVVGLGKGRK